MPNEKLSLEIEKLRLEILKPRWKETLTTLGGLATTIGVITTICISTYQMMQTRQSRENESFEQASKHLWSNDVRERLSGIATIQQLLASERGSDHQLEAFGNLVNAAIIEEVPLVRSAALDALVKAGKTTGNQQAIFNEALNLAVERNRSVYTHLLSDSFGSNWMKYMSWRADTIPTIFKKASKEDMQILNGSASVIAALIRDGARSTDLSLIYCERCVISTWQARSNLNGVKFDRAYLRFADFSGANLQRTSFRNAYISYTQFVGSNLANAELGDDVPEESFGAVFITAGLGGRVQNEPGADFACSNLKQADFSGRNIISTPLARFAQNDVFYGADLAGANFLTARIISTYDKGELNLRRSGQKLLSGKDQLRASAPISKIFEKEESAEPEVIRSLFEEIHSAQNPLDSKHQKEMEAIIRNRIFDGPPRIYDCSTGESHENEQAITGPFSRIAVSF